MIEFDVRPRGSQLLVAHLAPQARRPWCLTLDDALDHLAEPCFSQIALNVDVKGRGCESALVMLHHKLVDAQIAESIWRLGQRLFAWTVDEPALFARMADLGVAGVATNDPARLRGPH